MKRGGRVSPTQSRSMTVEDGNVPETYEQKINRGLRKLYPSVREREEGLSLPRRWDMTQAAEVLELSADKLTVSFKKNVANDSSKDSSAIIRGDAHIPSSIGLYYFEVEIVKGDEGCMGIGLSKKGGHLNRMPGWDPSCYGYHGDDGNSFSNCGTGKKYGPKFGTGDVIGCGIDTFLYQVFFTKNGRFLGIAYEEKTPFEKLYPTVGLKNPGEQLSANFGHKPFMFDFDAFRDALIKRKIKQLEATPMPEAVGTYMNRIVLSFLGDSGAIDTLQSFEKIAKRNNGSDVTFLRNRKEVVEMIMGAANGSAIQERIDKHFPGRIGKDIGVQLLLLCLRYIDLAITLRDPPLSFKKSQCIQITSPTDSSLRLTKNTKNQTNPHKRTRGDRSSSPLVSPATRKPSSHTRSPESSINDERIREYFTDEDTGEEMISIDGFALTKRMYVDLTASDEYEKLSYLMKMGREINHLSKTITLSAEEREIVEISMSMVLKPKASETHPLSKGQRRYIANQVTRMINLNAGRGTSVVPGKKVYSELRGMFLGWRGVHAEASSRDHPAAAISFLKNMVVHPKNFGDEEIFALPEEHSITEARNDMQQDEEDL